MACGPGSRPRKGKEGETKFGFVIDQRVRIADKKDWFHGWVGHVLAFDENTVAVDLDEPPKGSAPNGQWFRPGALESAPPTL